MGLIYLPHRRKKFRTASGLALTPILGEEQNFPAAVTAYSRTSSSFTPPDNSLLVVHVSSLILVNTSLATALMSGGGLTWTKRKSFNSLSSGYSVAHEIITAPVTTATSMACTYSQAGLNTNGNSFEYIMFMVFAYTGYNVLSPIGGTASGVVLGVDAVNITLDATPATSSIVSASRLFVPNGASDISATPGIDWTEQYDITDSTHGGYGGLQTQTRGNSNSTSVSWLDYLNATDTSFMDSAFAIEIKAA